jgi:hypothetical protein
MNVYGTTRVLDKTFVTVIPAQTMMIVSPPPLGAKTPFGHIESQQQPDLDNNHAHKQHQEMTMKKPQQLPITVKNSHQTKETSTPILDQRCDHSQRSSLSASSPEEKVSSRYVSRKISKSKTIMCQTTTP